MLKEDLNFLQVVSIVTSRFGCTIDGIDLEGRTLSITCPRGKEQEIECATAIEDIMEGKRDSATIWAVS